MKALAPTTKVNRCARALSTLLVTIFMALSVNAQSATDGSTPLALTPGSPAGSYPLSDMDSVNLYNGTLNFRLPLLGVAGRGGAGYPITLHIDKKWTVYKHYEPGVGYFYYPDHGWWSEDGEGWRFFEAGKVNIRSAHREQGGFPVEALTRITFTAPDGTEYELRDQKTGGQPISPSGGFNRGKVFVTADGSSATFISDGEILDDPTNGQGYYDDRPEGYLLLKDGSRFRVDDGKISWMRDRNGNKASFTYDFLRRVTGVTDSLGRQVTITYPSGGVTFTAISFKGFGGAQRTIKIGQTNLGSALRSDYSPQTLQQLFPELHSFGAWDTTVVNYVELPDGRRYQFQYNSYAELARITLPSGGAIEYDYAAGLANGSASGVFNLSLDKYIYRRVVERRIYPDGGSGAGYESRMTYSRPETTTGNDEYVITEQFNQAGTRLSKSKHYFSGSPRLSFNQKPTHYPAWQDGREYQTEIFDTNGTTILRRTNSTFAQRAPVSWWTGTPETAPPNDTRLIETSAAMEPSGANLVSKQTFLYDQYNNQTGVYEYAFGTGSAGALVRRSETEFLTTNSVNGATYDTLNPNATDPSPATTIHIRSLPKQASTFDAGGIERARVAYEYDNYATDTNHYFLTDRADISGFDAGFGVGYSARGNATASTSFLLTNGAVTGSFSGYQQYDIAGNVVKTIDLRGNITTQYFDDRFGAPDAEAQANSGAVELGSQKSYAFPTKVTNALGHSVFTQYDFYLGKPVDAEDANNVTFTAHYNDLLDRPTQLINASNQGSTVKSQAIFAYDDVNRVITSTSDQTVFNDPNPLKSQTVYDLLGRTIETRQYETNSNYITIKTNYDALGRAYRSSNPFRAGENVLWTTSAFDALGRVTSVTTPDSAVVTTNYSGNNVTVADQSGKSRKSVTDALGRLLQVYEDPNGLNYLTSYSYDVLDNLTSVAQGVQTRTFAYNSLKRLTSATNPESGTISYVYDAAGNLSQKTDARGVTSGYVYDALNRNTNVNYSDATPDTLRQYDLAIKGKGRINQTWQSGSITSATYIDEYDALGRPKIQRQRYETAGVWSGSYQVARTYDLAGHVKTQTYPSGHAVTYNYDQSGRLADKDAQNLAFTGNLGDGVTRNYSTEVVYSPFGSITKEKFGTDAPLYNKSFYNSRGQLAEIRLGTYHATDGTWWNRGAIINHYSNACWGACGGSNSTSAMTDNNGNLKKQDVYIPANDQITGYTSWWQGYDYDALNRLQRVHEYNGNDWQQEYVYDSYGNRTLHQANTYGSGINKKEFTVNTANNRLGVPGGQSGTMAYDNAGNLTTDTYSGAGVTRAYDAENRMTSETQASSYLAGVYSYNADGQRVRRKVGGLETWQVYGMDGELLAEYAVNGGPANAQKEYGYRNGQLLITTGPSEVFVSSLSWTSATNGWGPVERNLSNGESGAGDGTTIRLNGVAYASGLGVHADSDVRFNLAGQYATFASDLGVDDEVGSSGSVKFQVWADGALLYDSGVMNASSATQTVNVSVAGKNELRLLVTNGGDNHNYDHADWANARLIKPGTTADIQWLVADQLGTPRMVFDKTGALDKVKRHDYLPFGEELFAGQGQRTSTLGYSGDNIRQKFTSKERDNETGLDYFLARYYSSTQGRFTSPDEFSGGPDELHNFAETAAENPTFYAELDNPQSLNKYQYTYNDPLNLTDEDGHCPPCVAAAGAVVVLILTSPDTVNAPGPGDPVYPSGDGVTTMLATATGGVIAGPILTKAAGPITRAVTGRIGARAGGPSVGAEVSASVPKAARTSSSSALGRTATTKTTGAKGQKTTTTVTDPAGSTTYKTTPGKTGGQSTTIVRKDAQGNVKYVKQEARHKTKDFNKPADHKHYKRPKDKEMP